MVQSCKRNICGGDCPLPEIGHSSDAELLLENLEKAIPKAVEQPLTSRSQADSESSRWGKYEGDGEDLRRWLSLV